MLQLLPTFSGHRCRATACSCLEVTPGWPCPGTLFRQLAVGLCSCNPCPRLCISTPTVYSPFHPFSAQTPAGQSVRYQSRNREAQPPVTGVVYAPAPVSSTPAVPDPSSDTGSRRGPVADNIITSAGSCWSRGRRQQQAVAPPTFRPITESVTLPMGNYRTASPTSNLCSDIPRAPTGASSSIPTPLPGTNHLHAHPKTISSLYNPQSIFKSPLPDALGNLAQSLSSHQCKVGIFQLCTDIHTCPDLNPLTDHCHPAAPLLNHVHIQSIPVVPSRHVSTAHDLSGLYLSTLQHNGWKHFLV